MTRLRLGLLLTLGQAASRGALALFTLLLVRLLSPADFGDFAVVLALFSLLVVVGDGGFSRLLVREVARAPADPGRLLAGLMEARAPWLGAAVLGACALAATGALPVGPTGLTLVLVALVAEIVASGLEAGGIGAERGRRVATAQAAAGLSLLGVGVPLLSVGGTLLAAIAALAAGSVAKAVVAVALWRHDLAGPRPSAEQQRLWARRALPYLALTGLGIVYYRVDVLVLRAVSGPVETASYAAAYRLVDLAVLAGAIATATVSAHLSRSHLLGGRHVYQAWQSYVARVVVVGVPVAIILALFAEPVSATLFGETYRAAAGADLRLLAPMILLVMLQQANAAVLLTGDLQTALVACSTIHVAVKVGVTVVLVQAHGSEGAAVAATSAEAVTAASFAALVWWRYGRPG